MLQEQLSRLADQFIGNAIGLQRGEKIWIEWAGSDAAPLAKACIDKAKSLGGVPHPQARGSEYINNLLSAKPSQDELIALGLKNLETMKQMDCYIRIGDIGDQTKLNEFGDLYDDYKRLAVREFTNHRVINTRWLVVRAPTDHFAKACGMTMDQFTPFYMGANLFDYSTMVSPAEKLRILMAEGKDVEIKGKGTDLKFSIEGIGAKSCIGKFNIPDGEVFTAPVKGSVNGYVTFGPSVYNGKSFDEIFLRYKEGKIIEAKSTTESSTRDLNRIFDTDEGARYPGEFAIGFNPNIQFPVGDILFDEKIKGSFHIANGICYENYADNGNQSAIHWDVVQIQRPDYGGGTIAIDGRIIRKDGIFIVPELEALNPENLLARQKS